MPAAAPCALSTGGSGGGSASTTGGSSAATTSGSGTGALSADYQIEVPYGKYTTTLGYRYIAPYDQQIARDDSIPVPLNDGTTVLTSNDARVRTNVQNLLDASIGLAIPGEHGETTAPEGKTNHQQCDVASKIPSRGTATSARL